MWNQLAKIQYSSYGNIVNNLCQVLKEQCNYDDKKNKELSFPSNDLYDDLYSLKSLCEINTPSVASVKIHSHHTYTIRDASWSHTHTHTSLSHYTNTTEGVTKLTHRYSLAPVITRVMCRKRLSTDIIIDIVSFKSKTRNTVLTSWEEEEEEEEEEEQQRCAAGWRDTKRKAGRKHWCVGLTAGCPDSARRSPCPCRRWRMGWSGRGAPAGWWRRRGGRTAPLHPSACCPTCTRRETRRRKVFRYLSSDNVASGKSSPKNENFSLDADGKFKCQCPKSIWKDVIYTIFTSCYAKSVTTRGHCSAQWVSCTEAAAATGSSPGLGTLYLNI